MLEIRVVHTLEEIQEVHRLVEKIWPEIYTPVIGSEQVAYMLENYQSFKVIQKDLQKGDHYFLLYEGDRAVGYTAYRENSEEIYISKLYLDKETRGKGYGKELFRWYEQIAANKKQRLNVNKENELAIAIYESQGFRRVAACQIAIGGGFIMDDYIYEKYSQKS